MQGRIYAVRACCVQVVKLKQVEHTLCEKNILQAIKYAFIVRLDYSFKVTVRNTSN